MRSSAGSLYIYILRVCMCLGKKSSHNACHVSIVVVKICYSSECRHLKVSFYS